MPAIDRYLPPLSPAGRRWVRFVVVVVAVVGLVELVIYLRAVLTPLAVALAVAYVLNPLVTAAERRGLRRLHVITGLYVFGLTGLGALLIVTGLVAAQQLSDFATKLPGYLDWVMGWIQQFTTTAPAPETAATATDDVKRNVAGWGQAQFAELVKEHGAAAVASTATYLARLFSNAWYWLSFALLVPLYSFFFLWRMNDMVAAVREHLPSPTRPTIVHIVTTIDRATATFFRGRLIVCLLLGLFTGIGWTLVGVPGSMLLGAASAVLNLIPYLSVLALPPALILRYLDAVQADEEWLWPIILTLGVYLLVQGLESLVLTPYVESQSSGLHPVTTVVALMVGAKLAGLLGMLLSIPVASTLKSLGREYLLPEIRELAGLPPRPPPTAGRTGGAVRPDYEI